MTPELKQQIDKEAKAYAEANHSLSYSEYWDQDEMRQDAYTEAATIWAERAEKLREALERIANPIAALQKQASADGRYMDGTVAQSLADNAPYLRLQAQEALEQYKQQTT